MNIKWIIPCSTKHFRRFFSNIIGLPERRNKRMSVLFLNLNDKIIEQEMFFLSNTRMTSLLSYTVNMALVNRARFC